MQSKRFSPLTPHPKTGSVHLAQNGAALCLHFQGDWRIDASSPPLPEITRLLADALTSPSTNYTSLEINTDALQDWDSRLLLILRDLREWATAQGLDFSESELPAGIHRLLALVSASPDNTQRRTEMKAPSFFAIIGSNTQHLLKDCQGLFSFTGLVTLSYLRLFTGKAQFLRSDFLYFLEECGPAALPIVSLIAVLIGVILAFVGAVQLQLFGAEIYIANLVALGMTREMGAMMAAIIMGGRTGAAFAAQLGTMQVNEEIDALQTMGIDPIDFLVLPRLSSLLIMMPLLALWADLIGIAGGFLMALTLDISMVEYYNQTINSVNLRHFGVGLFKAVIFGYLIAFSGCLRGIQCGRSASAVGTAATSAVVTAIVFIVVSDALMTVIFNILKI